MNTFQFIIMLLILLAYLAVMTGLEHAMINQQHQCDVEAQFIQQPKYYTL